MSVCFSIGINLHCLSPCLSFRTYDFLCVCLSVCLSVCLFDSFHFDTKVNAAGGQGIYFWRVPFCLLPVEVGRMSCLQFIAQSVSALVEDNRLSINAKRVQRRFLKDVICCSWLMIVEDSRDYAILRPSITRYATLPIKSLCKTIGSTL